MAGIQNVSKLDFQDSNQSLKVGMPKILSIVKSTLDISWNNILKKDSYWGNAMFINAVVRVLTGNASDIVTNFDSLLLFWVAY